MATLEITSFVLTASIAGIALIRMIKDSLRNLPSIVLNIMFGGFLFAILNILGFSITLNFITGTIIALLGVPGIALIVVLKLIFGIF